MVLNKMPRRGIYLELRKKLLEKQASERVKIVMKNLTVTHQNSVINTHDQIYWIKVVRGPRPAHFF